MEHGYGSQVVFNGQIKQTEIYGYATEHIYCGHHIPSDYFANSKEVLVKFKTDLEIEATGFEISVTSVSGEYGQSNVNEVPTM